MSRRTEIICDNCGREMASDAPERLESRHIEFRDAISCSTLEVEIIPDLDFCNHECAVVFLCGAITNHAALRGRIA